MEARTEAATTDRPGAQMLQIEMVLRLRLLTSASHGTPTNPPSPRPPLGRH